MPQPRAEPIEPGCASAGPRPGQLSALLQELVRATQEGAGPGWEHAPRPGAVVGRFELLREIGRGAFGVVYEAKDHELGRRVAFKAVRAGPRPEVNEERLLREAEAAAQLSHPNIVTLFDVGRSEGGAYLVLELLEGETLASRLAQGQLTVRDAVHVATEVARALAHAHAHGVVHRDLKPANVFVCADGRVKVLDFGLAHAFGHRRLAGGTPGYMPPEQAEDAPEDERSDVWALGAMLFEMLSGQPPFPDEQSLQRPAPALDVAGLPALGELVARMLAPRPVDRPRDGAEVLAAVEPIERDVASAPASILAPVRVRRRHARRWALAASAAIALVLAIAALTIARQRAAHGSLDKSASIAVLAFADLSPQRDQEYLGDGVAEEILNALSRVQGLRVIGRTSSFSFKGKSDDLKTIGRKLDVTAVLEGSVRRLGRHVRIATNLVRAQDGSTLWAETFDRDDKNLFATQDEVARSVTTALRVKLLEDRTEPTTLRTDVPEAHVLLLRGRRLMLQGTLAGMLAASEAFEQALKLDPQYAPPYAELSLALGNLAGLYYQAGPDAVRRARDLAERAITLAPTYADAYTTRAIIRKNRDWDWAGARDDLDRALALAPNDLAARHWRARLLAVLGQTEQAIEELRSVVQDDPLATGRQIFLSKLYLVTGRAGESRKLLKQVLELEPTNDTALLNLAAWELHAGNPGAALALADKIQLEYWRRYIVGRAQHDLGHEREAQEAIDWLEQWAGSGCHRECRYVAELYANRGELDAAFAWLEKAYAAHEGWMDDLTYSLVFRKYRFDPRFRDLLRRMNLPVD